MSKILRISDSNEVRLIAVLVAVTLALGVAGIFSVPFITIQDRSGDYIESYMATLYSDGRLDETYVYHLVSSNTRMLFRFWDMPLVLEGLNIPHIVPIGIVPPSGAISYVKDFKGRVTIMSEPVNIAYVSTIGSLAYLNEAGCYKPNYFSPGIYTITYHFRILPEIERDDSYDHLNLMLAREHMLYRNIRVVLEDAGYISTVYQHPPSLSVGHEGSDVVISGSSGENELLEVELLMPTVDSPWHNWIYGVRETDVKGLTEAANRDYSIKYWGAYGINLISKIVVILIPLSLIAIWLIFSREEDVTVPTYLSTIPNPERKPWLVNLVFNKSVNAFDENGFYATLLDLHNRGKVKIETREGGMKIFITEKTVDDAYEQRVLDFLAKYSTLDVSNPANPQMVFDTTRARAHAGLLELIQLTKKSNQPAISKAWNKLCNTFFDKGNQRLLWVFGVGIVLVIVTFAFYSPIVIHMLWTPFVLGIIVIVQGAIAYFFPASLFGRWRKGLYKEKLEWDAFRSHLGDFSQLSKYSTKDLSMWGSWLVYGTALGVGDKVAQAMKELNVSVDVAPAAIHVRNHFHPMIMARLPVSSGGGRSGGHRGGGGGRHGGGGGRGGGGAGRR